MEVLVSTVGSGYFYYPLFIKKKERKKERKKEKKKERKRKRKKERNTVKITRPNFYLQSQRRKKETWNMACNMAVKKLCSPCHTNRLSQAWFPVPAD